MYLTISGKCKNVDRNMIKDAVTFYAEYFDIDDKNFDLYLDFEKNLKKNSGDEGYCVSEGARQYTISIDNGFSKRKTLIALAHEMVHIKQYVKRELTHNERKKLSRYKGVIVEDKQQLLYWELPWEIEAFGRELGLYALFMESRKNKS